jgi:hypothetical protein
MCALFNPDREPDANLFTVNTNLPCQGAHCVGSIMHERRLYSPPFNPATDVIGPSRYSRSYEDHYYCSNGCGLRYEQPKNYNPPSVGQLIAEANARLSKKFERALAQAEQQQGGDAPEGAQ